MDFCAVQTLKKKEEKETLKGILFNHFTEVEKKLNLMA